jgi:Cu-Zn family superoxide dismutase
MRKTSLVAAVLTLALLGGCQTSGEHRHHMVHAEAGVQMAVCQISPTAGNTAVGTVTFTQSGGVVKVVADIKGLKPGQKHGFHIHEGTECGEDGMKAGGHYNPEGHEHALPDKPVRHAGDMGNLQADDKGVAHLEMVLDNVTIDGAYNPIVGRTVIVHALPDDGGQPTGNAGGRIGCGVIKVVTGM